MTKERPKGLSEEEYQKERKAYFSPKGIQIPITNRRDRRKKAREFSSQFSKDPLAILKKARGKK